MLVPLPDNQFLHLPDPDDDPAGGDIPAWLAVVLIAVLVGVVTFCVVAALRS